MRVSRSNFGIILLCVATAAAQTSAPVPTTAPGTQPALVPLAGGDFLGLMTVCRYVERADGSLDVMLATGPTLTLNEPGDVRAVRRGLGRLNVERRLQLFWPSAAVAINLDQVTNVWNDARGFTFWGTDGQAWSVADAPDNAAIWARLRSQTAPATAPAVPLIEVTPSLLVNPRHVAHVSSVDGKLRFLMSNASWPMIEAAADVAAAQRVLRELMPAIRE